ncbi:MAG: S8 family serine peptidase [Flavobacteriia bacterium]
MKKFLFTFLITCSYSLVYSQQGKVWVTVGDSEFHQYYSINGGTLVSTDELFNQLIQKFSISVFRQALPSSRNKDLLKVYELTCECNENELIQEITKSKLPFSKPVIGPKYELLNVPNDYNASFATDYALDLIKAKQAWEITHGDPTIVISITDANYHLNHEELVGKVNYVSPNSATDYTHGTVVAITAAGNTNNGIGKSSIGYDTRLDLRAMSYNDVLDASYAGAQIVNLSWTSGCDFSEYLQTVIDEAYGNGTVLIAAAGNGGTCGAPGNLVYPASFNHVISVTSVGPNDNHERYIGNSASTHQHNSSVDICAPGYDVALSTSPGVYLTGNGTSFAAPYVSGTVALMLAVNPCLNSDEVEYILKETAANIDAQNQNYLGLLGAGRLNAQAAVQMASTFNTFNMGATKTIDCSNMSQGISLNLNQGGIAPYSIHWSNGSTATALTNLNPGTYSVIVRDSAGCVSAYSAQISTVAPIFLNEQLHDPLCFGAPNGEITLSVTGGQGNYNYLWNTGETTSGIQGLIPGVYFVIVSDSAGCSGAEIYELHEPTQLLVDLQKTDIFYSAGGSIDLTVSGGTAPYSYLWSNGASTQDLNNLPTGFYEVIVLDAHGCELSLNTTIALASPFDEMNEPAELLSSAEQVGLSNAQTLNQDITIKYNPANQKMNLSWTFDGVVNLSLFNLNGQLVQEFKQFSGKNLELDNFAKGEYLFRLTDNSKINLVRKISFY